MDELDASAIIASFGLPITLVLHRAELSNVRFYAEPRTEAGKIELTTLLSDPPLDEDLFHGQSAGALSLADVWIDFMARAGQSMYHGLTEGSPPVERGARARFPDPENTLMVTTSSEGDVRVNAIQWDISAWIEEQVVDPPVVREYRGEDDEVLARIETYSIDVGARRVSANLFRVPSKSAPLAGDRVVWRMENEEERGP